MSAFYFECVITQQLQAAEDFFALFHDASWNRVPHSQLKVKELLGLSPEEKLPLIELSTHRQNGRFKVSFQTATRVNIQLFIGIGEYLTKVEGIHFQATFFDSSSGGSEEWQMP